MEKKENKRAENLAKAQFNDSLKDILRCAENLVIAAKNAVYNSDSVYKIDKQEQPTD